MVAFSRSTSALLHLCQFNILCSKLPWSLGGSNLDGRGRQGHWGRRAEERRKEERREGRLFGSADDDRATLAGMSDLHVKLLPAAGVSPWNNKIAASDALLHVGAEGSADKRA